MSGAVPAPSAAAARLAKIEVTDFRAFPKEHPGIFDLGVAGCNLLAFGENGSGKSSLYRALRELFSTYKNDILPYRNVFTDGPAPRVRVTLTDGKVLDWTAAVHPTSDVIDIARRSSFLTHTALRELIYNPEGVDQPNNIFKIAIDQLIGDFDATLEGGARRSVAELWGDVDRAYKARVITASGGRRPQNYVPAVNAACHQFNEGMKQALDSLEARAKVLLRRLLDVFAVDSLDLEGLLFNQIRYFEVKPGVQGVIENASLVVRVKVHEHRPPAPQNFLNEARQTALALAIYLASRQICAPPGKSQLKLLVMDDLLISLDASHRRPVLDLILSEFAEWQIMLLTHDRYWFQLAREQLPNDTWKTVEIFERFDGDGLLCPLVRPVVKDMAAALLEQADAFVADNHPAAACNYARSACELFLQRFCIINSVKFVYQEDGAVRPNLQKLLNAAMNKVSQDPEKHSVLKALKIHKQYVLNPLSHNPAMPIPSADVRAAIDAVRAMAAVL